jgi:hypothetical protein
MGRIKNLKIGVNDRNTRKVSCKSSFFSFFFYGGGVGVLVFQQAGDLDLGAALRPRRVQAEDLLGVQRGETPEYPGFPLVERR